MSQRHTLSSLSSISEEDSRLRYDSRNSSQPLLSNDAVSIPVSKWPLQPQTIRSQRKYWVAHIIWILVVLPYVILALYALIGHNRTVSQGTWDRLQTAIKVAVTVFPIAFAAIVSRMLRQISQWQLERSASLGSVEQLRRSSTVFGTLSILYVLRSLNLVGLGLLLLWALSPLGAQSALRILSAEQRHHNTTLQLAYLDISQTTSKSLNPSLVTSKNDLADQLFVSNILAPRTTRLSSMDAWGNVKIPFVTDTAGDWQPVTPDIEYSSLLGIPVLGLPVHANASFTISTAYLVADCFQLGINNNASAMQPSAINLNGVPILKYIPANSVGTPPGHDGPIIRWSSPDYANMGDYHYVVANCTLTQQSLDARIGCTAPNTTTGIAAQQNNCSTTAVRTTSSSTPPLLAPLFDTFGGAMMNTTPAGHPFYPTLEEHYLHDIDEWDHTSWEDFSALSNLPAAVFSRRLSQLINSYYTARLGYELITAQSDQPASNASYTTAVVGHVAAPATLNNPGPTVVTHWPWVPVFIVAVVVLVVAVVLTPVVQSRTLTPDILGYVSSLTRENPYVRLPGPASTLSGAERARLLRDVRVRLGDVQSGVAEVGRLGVGSVQSTARSRGDRFYQ
ncbi:hypothetical protein BDV59DRAFT_202997 [Aspergillus ambiguus]|uniref:uncharacterized protein n=1 Tax=Aspergillus ambiguus TaxID=176160 RepID=UPI003CCE4E02